MGGIQKSWHNIGKCEKVLHGSALRIAQLLIRVVGMHFGRGVFSAGNLINTLRQRGKLPMNDAPRRVTACFPGLFLGVCMYAS